MRLFWDANPDPSTEYIVEYNLPFPNDAVVRRLSVTTSYATIDGLEPNSEYAFRVRASNSAGAGELSPAVVLRTPEG